MNVLRLKEFCIEHHNTYLGSWTKHITRLKPGTVCSYSNHLASRPVGHSMQRSLKLKLQNAINKAFADTGSPAIFIGGRRHNRKKRKSKNGQNKKKTNKKVGVTSPTPSSKTPHYTYYEDGPIRYNEPKVSCLDIKEPVFANPSIKLRLKDADRDSMYNSSDSLSSYTSERSATSHRGSIQQTVDTHDSTDTIAAYKVGIPRLHSRDSGVYDDDEDDYDVGFCDDITAEYDEINAYERSVQDELLEVNVDDNELEDKTHLLVSVNDIELSDITEQTDEIKELVTETRASTEVIDELEKVEVRAPVDGESSLAETDAAVLQVDVEEDDNNEGKFEVRSLQGLEEADPFLKFVNTQDDEEEIVFDLSQLEVNNLDEISKTKETHAVEQLSKDQYVPTVLEDEIPLTVPLDLLIDEDDDEVLFEARPRKELSITCNPLYDYTVMEEEDKLSIKSYQSGFKTDFDNIGFTQISVPASDKAAHKTTKESTPLIKRPPICGDRDDELSCCVIL